MWNPFKKRQPPPPAPPANRVAALADRLAEGRFDEVDASLKRLTDEHLTPDELELWWHLYGISASRRNNDREALERFEQGHRACPRSAAIRFSLGQQYERARRIDEAFAMFDGCRFPDVSGDYVMAQARYAYLWNRYDRGRAYLRSILDAYMKLKILDDTFLHMRGLPFFASWWAYLAAFSVLTGDWSEIEQVTRDVSAHCGDYHFEDIKAELAARRAGDMSALVGMQEAALERASRHKIPTGYHRLTLAIARARHARDAREAGALVDSVEVSQQDFPWLDDIRVLARAEIAGRFGRKDEEARLQDEFCRRQPLLFEPDHALNFHLLVYQDTLKPRYQGATPTA